MVVKTYYFQCHELKSVNLKTRFNLSKKDLSKKYALVFNMLGGVPNASLKGLIPPF